MQRQRASTTFNRLTPFAARTCSGGLIATTVIFAAITLSPFAPGQVGKPLRGSSDIELYRAEVERIRHGEGYYDAAAAELIARGYPTQSVFNWRTPLPMWFIGHLPDPVLGRALLGLLAAGVMVLGFEAMARDAATVHALQIPLICVAGR